jgi:hypothetical protein
MKNHNNSLRWLRYLILGGFLIKLFCFLFKGKKVKKIVHNFKDFFKKEKREVEEFVAGKESFKEYCEDSGSIFKNYFIPNKGNGFKPKILRTKQLAIIAALLLFLKISVTSYLFFIYPNLARMSAILESEFYNLINIERKSNGVPLLTTNSVLNEVARAKAEDMINKGYFAHKSPDGKMIWDMINRNEYPYLYVGENLAMNFTSARSAHKALMLSPAHKKNILNSKYTEMGIAVASGKINNKETNILVEVFAYPQFSKPAIAMESNLKKEASPNEPAKAPFVKQTESAPKPQGVVSRILSAESKAGGDREEYADKEQPTDRGKNKKVAEQGLNNGGIEAPRMASIKKIGIEDPQRYTGAAKAINYLQYVFVGALIFLIILLLINILVRASIQHKPVIIQTILVIIFIIGLISIKIHFLEKITENIMVI